MEQHSRNLSLVILAAGVGRRFGGLKQLVPVGPGGEAILDYTVFDAIRAGVDHVVFVVRPEIETEFRTFVEARFADRAKIDFVCQRIDALPGGFMAPAARTKPWGTAHAVLAAANAVCGPFMVANADDFYGADAIDAMARFLAGGGEEYGLVTYAMRDTLPPDAAVSRALCRVSAGGYLESIEELTAVKAAVGRGRGASGTDVGAVSEGPDGTRRLFRGDEPVSMNLWGLHHDVFEHLRVGFRAFLTAGTAHRAVAQGDAPAAGKTITRTELLASEYYLPDCINDLVAAGRKRVRVLRAGGSRWFGMTHPADRERVAAAIGRLVEQGAYPERLWT